MAQTCGCKSRCELVTVSKFRRNCMRFNERGKDAWSANRDPKNNCRIVGVIDRGEWSRSYKALVIRVRAASMRRVFDEGVRSYPVRSVLAGEGPKYSPEREVSRGRRCSSGGR
jgi:hypothetical protein